MALPEEVPHEITIPQLPSVSTLGLTAYVPISQSGVTYKTTVATILGKLASQPITFLDITTTATDGTLGLRIRNSSSQKLLQVASNGYNYIGNNSSSGVFIASGYQGVEVPDPNQTAQNNLVFGTNLGNIAGKGFIFTNPVGSFSPPSGTAAVMAFGSVEFAALSGTGDFTSYLINPEISQSGGSGTVRGIHYSPTMSFLSGAHYAIETAVGDVMIGTTSGKLKVGTVAAPKFQAWFGGEWAFNGASPSASDTGWTDTSTNYVALKDVAFDLTAVTASDANFRLLSRLVVTLQKQLVTKGVLAA